MLFLKEALLLKNTMYSSALHTKNILIYFICIKEKVRVLSADISNTEQLTTRLSRCVNRTTRKLRKRKHITANLGQPDLKFAF